MGGASDGEAEAKPARPDMRALYADDEPSLLPSYSEDGAWRTIAQRQGCAVKVVIGSLCLSHGRPTHGARLNRCRVRTRLLILHTM
jgi:hypothetical protein